MAVNSQAQRLLASTLTTLRPGALWSTKGDTYADIVWLDATQAIPSSAEFGAEMARQQAAVSVPSPVSPRQARLALLQQGLLPTVEAAVATIGGATQITWEYATMFERNDPMIIALGAQLGLSSAQIDQLFILAATL